MQIFALGKRSLNRMEKQKQSPSCYAALWRESLLRSVLSALAVGAGAGFVTAAVLWFTGALGIWLPIAVVAALTVITTPIFYVRIFRPTARSNARRIDGCGLEERAITMVEFEGDSSYMAQRQREDAKKHIAEMDAHSIRITVPTVVTVLSSVAAVLCIGMTLVTGLARAGYLPSGKDFIDGVLPEPDTVLVEVSYIAFDGGVLEGDEVQIIPQGGETIAVTAVPDEGYAFYMWDDGSKRPTRYEKNVTEDMVFTAIFMPLGDDGAGIPGDGPPKEGDPSDRPGNPGNQPGQQMPGQNTGGAGGQYQECNQVIDGETYYGSIYDEYYDAIRAALMENSDMSAETKSFIDNYFKIIQVSDPDEDDGN